MGVDSGTKAYPQLVKLDKALKLAEAWVNSMSRSTETEPKEVEYEGRPPRLGLGAKVPRHVELADSNDPVERKLRGKLGSMKRRSAKNLEESNPTETVVQSDEDDNEPESRTNAFVKKKATLPPSSLHSKKRKK